MPRRLASARPAAIASYWFAPAHERAPGGESFNDVFARTVEAIRRIRNDLPAFGRHMETCTVVRVVARSYRPWDPPIRDECSCGFRQAVEGAFKSVWRVRSEP